MSTDTSISTSRVYQDLGLDRIFDDHAFTTDLVAGKVMNPAHNRILYLSEDIIRGIYEALVEETGPAWKLILYNCGLLWGQRLVKRVDREMNDLCQTSFSKLPLSAFLQFVENYFAAHGWGQLSIDVRLTQEHGVIRLQLDNSFCAQVLQDVDDFADPLVAGTLAALFTYISGRDLTCLQITSPTMGEETSEFVISTPERIESVEEEVERGVLVDELVAKLMA